MHVLGVYFYVHDVIPLNCNMSDVSKTHPATCRGEVQDWRTLSIRCWFTARLRHEVHGSREIASFSTKHDASCYPKQEP